MSWLSEVFGGTSPTNVVTSPQQFTEEQWKAARPGPAQQGEPDYYESIKQFDPKYIAEQQAIQDAAQQQAIAAAQASNPVAPPPAPNTSPPPPVGYSGPSATEKLSALLPTGFETSSLPSSFADPFVESAFGGAKQRAGDFIDTLLKRGTATQTGADAARGLLGSQDTAVRGRLSDVANLQLEQERAKLRGIAGEGFAAAGQPGETGEFFDPSPYQSRVQSDVASFQQAFPESYTSAVGDVGYDTGGLGGAAGTVTGPRNVTYDPYAVEGGKLSTGLDESGALPTPSKKRSTAVF